MDELTLIKARALVEEIRHYNAEAERDTVQYGGWQCDYTTEVVKCQKELDKLLALSPAPSAPEGMVMVSREKLRWLRDEVNYAAAEGFELEYIRGLVESSITATLDSAQ